MVEAQHWRHTHNLNISLPMNSYHMSSYLKQIESNLVVLALLE